MDIGVALSIASVFATVVAAAAAVVSAHIAWKTLRGARAPHVIAYVYAPDDLPLALALRVENIGGGPAWDVSVSLDALALANPPLPGEALETFVSQTCPFLPPGGWREANLGVGRTLVEAMGDREERAVVSYAMKEGGKKQREEFPIEVRSFRGGGRGRPVNHLAGMDESLRDIARALKAR